MSNVYHSQDYGTIVELFRKYEQATHTQSITKIGFSSYLMGVIGYPPNLVRLIEKDIDKDKDLNFFINRRVEEQLLEGALTGKLKGVPSMFLLKNHFGYADSPKEVGEVNQKVKTIRYVQAKAPEQIEGEAKKTFEVQDGNPTKKLT